MCYENEEVGRAGPGRVQCREFFRPKRAERRLDDFLLDFDIISPFERRIGKVRLVISVSAVTDAQRDAMRDTSRRSDHGDRQSVRYRV